MNCNLPQRPFRSGTRFIRVLVTCSCVAVVVGCGGTSSDSKSDNPPKVPATSTALYGSPAEAWLTSGARTATSADGTYRVAWEPIGGTIPDAEPFAIAVEVARVDGAPLVQDVVVLVDAEMPHHGHGMNLVPVVKPGPRPGTFVAEGLLLHMPGAWVVAIDVGEAGVSERTQWVLDVE